MNEEYSYSTAIRGFHVYRRVWTPNVEQILKAEKIQVDASPLVASLLVVEGGGQILGRLLLQ